MRKLRGQKREFRVQGSEVRAEQSRAEQSGTEQSRAEGDPRMGPTDQIRAEQNRKTIRSRAEVPQNHLPAKSSEPETGR